jgi:glycerol-3-phosphate acyltransferase PlsY
MQLWLCPLLAFLLGSIPFGLFIARMKGIDIRQHGSGNIGATNVLRVVGKKHGITCLILDALKGFVPVVIALNLVQIEGRKVGIPVPALEAFALHLPAAKQLTGQLIHVATALLAILGHNYSPWVGFKGGKGIATSAGVLLGLMPFAVVLLIGVWLLFFITTRYVSVASIAAAAALPVLTHVGARFHKGPDGRTLWEAGTWNKPLFVFSVVIAALAIWKHRANIRRLLDGTENRFRPKKKSNA